MSPGPDLVALKQHADALLDVEPEDPPLRPPTAAEQEAIERAVRAFKAAGPELLDGVTPRYDGRLEDRR